MQTLTVYLAPWATERILRDHCKPGTTRVTKAALRASLRAFPDTEFRDPDRRTLTCREAVNAGFEMLQVRRQNGDLLAVVTIGANRAPVVS